MATVEIDSSCLSRWDGSEVALKINKLSLEFQRINKMQLLLQSVSIYLSGVMKSFLINKLKSSECGRNSYHFIGFLDSSQNAMLKNKYTA